MNPSFGAMVIDISEEQWKAMSIYQNTIGPRAWQQLYQDTEIPEKNNSLCNGVNDNSLLGCHNTNSLWTSKNYLMMNQHQKTCNITNRCSFPVNNIGDEKCGFVTNIESEMKTEINDSNNNNSNIDSDNINFKHRTDYCDKIFDLEGHLGLPKTTNNIPTVAQNSLKESCIKDRKRRYSENFDNTLQTYVDMDGDTLLHILITKDEQQSSLPLVIQNCGEDEINAVNCHGQSPMHVAVYGDNMYAVKLLCRTNCVNLCQFDGYLNSPVHALCLMNPNHSSEIAETMSYCRGFRCVQYYQNEEGFSPIHLAALNKNVKMIEMLVKFGDADINANAGRTGNTPLMMLIMKQAIVKDILCVIQVLKANVNKRSFCNNTALHFACLQNNKEVVELLLENGAEVGEKNTNRKTEKDLTTSNEIKRMLESKLRKKRRLQHHG